MACLQSSMLPWLWCASCNHSLHMILPSSSSLSYKNQQWFSWFALFNPSNVISNFFFPTLILFNLKFIDFGKRLWDLAVILGSDCCLTFPDCYSELLLSQPTILFSLKLSAGTLISMQEPSSWYMIELLPSPLLYFQHWCSTFHPMNVTHKFTWYPDNYVTLLEPIKWLCTVCFFLKSKVNYRVGVGSRVWWEYWGLIAQVDLPRWVWPLL